MEDPSPIDPSSIKSLEIIHIGRFSQIFLVELQLIGNVFKSVMKVYHAPSLSQSVSTSTNDSLYIREKSAYERLHRVGICSQGTVPRYIGFLENIDVGRWEPELRAFAQNQHPPNAIFIEEISGMQMLDLDTFSMARMEKFVHYLKKIHEAHVLHGDPRPRNMMIVPAQDRSEERVLWLDFDRARTYREPLTEAQDVELREELQITEELGPVLEHDSSVGTIDLSGIYFYT